MPPAARRGKEARNIAKIAAARKLLTLFTTACATGTSATPHCRDTLHNLTRARSLAWTTGSHEQAAVR